MAYVAKDRVRETSTFTGTGDVTPLDGALDPSYEAFGDVMADGDTCDIAIFGAGDYEICPATYVSATNKLVRGAPTQSSNGDATVDFQAGTKTIIVTMPAARAKHLLERAGGFVNKFRNAAMDIWQRGTSGTITAGSPSHTADGWVAGSTGANVAWSRQTGRALSAYALRLTGATSVTGIFVRQRIESFLCFPLAGQSVTVQARVYNNTGGAITPTITVKRAGSTDNWSSPATDVNAVSLQSCADAAWTQVSHTFTANAGSGVGLEITLDFGNNFGSGTKYVQVTEPDIRVGSYIQIPELRPVSFESDFCQRYLPSWRSLNGAFGFGITQSSSQASVLLPFVTPPRVVPTGITISAASDFQALNSAGTLSAFSGFVFNTATVSGLNINGSGASSPASLTFPGTTFVYGNSGATIIATGAEL